MSPKIMEKRKKHKELDEKTSVKVSKSVSKARGQQNAYIIGMAILGGINAGLSNSTYSTDMALNNLRLSAILTKPVIAKTDLKSSPLIGESINEMQGLAENFAQNAWNRVEYNLRDHAL